MALFTISQLFSAPTADAFRAQMVTALVTMGVPADQWRKGGVASTMLTVVSMSLALMASLIATLVQGFFLPTATGTGLRLLAQFMYGVIIPDATSASGDVTLTNIGGGVYNIAAGQYTALDSSTNVTFTNVNSFSLGAGGTTSVLMRATVAGSAGNANPGAIDTSVTALIGVTVTNPASLVGVDAPTDATIRTLCLNSLGVRSVRGIRSAYAYAVQVATNPITGGPVNVNRWAIAADSHIGTVAVYVASPSGAASADDVTGVANSIEAIARPEAVVVVTTSAVAVPYTAAITIWAILPSGATSAQAATAAADALTTFIANYPIGGVIAADDLNPSLQGLFGTGVAGAIATGITAFGGTVLSVQGASDLALATNEVATDATTMAVRIVAPTAGTVTP